MTIVPLAASRSAASRSAASRTAASPMAAEDAVLLYAQAPRTQLQIGALCFFEAAPLRDRRGALRIEELRDHVAARLDRLPRFRQRIAPVLGDAAAPMWVDDRDFDIGRHCRVVELPEGSGPAGLRRFMDDLLADPMDLDHPLWDITTVTGIDGWTPDARRAGEGDGEPVDAVAVVVRAHHVMADGIALHAAATLLLEAAPQPHRPPSDPRVPAWAPAPAPGPVGLTARALAERTRRQVALAADVAGVALCPRRLGTAIRSAADTAGSARHLTSALAPAMDLTGPTGRRRAFAWGSVPMADVVAVKAACGATVNDVVLAIAAGALRRHQEATRTFDPHGRSPKALIPIGDPGSVDDPTSNRFSVTRVDLPVTVDDPLERVRLLHDRMHGGTAPSVRAIMPYVFSIADVLPPPIMRRVFPPVLSHQPLVNLAVSNIPGSRTPLYLWESRLLALHPFIDVVGSVAMIIGVLSYCDDLGVGVTVDPDVAGDPDEMRTHLRAAADELGALVR